MNATLYLLLITLISCVTTHNMEINPPKKQLLPEEIVLHLEEIWLNIIARCSAKGTLRATCTYFRDFASVANEKIFLQNPLVIKPVLLEQYALYYTDLDNNQVICNLLNQGLNPNTQDGDSNMSLLHYAAKNGNLSLSEILLKHPQFTPANATTDNFNGSYIMSPFGLALHHNRLAVAKHILAMDHINPNKVLDIYTSEASDSNKDILTDILSLDIDRQKLSKLLFYAADKGQIALVTMLLTQQDINVNYASPIFEETPLSRAALAGETAIVKLLIEHGAQFDKALSNAINKRNFNSVQLLITQGAPLDEKNRSGQTLLAQALCYTESTACARIVQLLLNKGTDVNEIVDNNGNVALGLIARRAATCHEAIKVLLAHPNIDINIKNNAGQTPLDIAREVRDRRKDSLDVHYWDDLIDHIKQHKSNHSIKKEQRREH